MKNDHSFFENKDCFAYPCHKLEPGEHLNCAQCFCPFYFISCPSEGTPIIIDMGKKKVKDCSQCTWIHNPRNYPKIMKYLTDEIYGSTEDDS